MSDDPKLFSSDVRMQVAGYEKSGLEFTAYTVVGVVQPEGGVIHYTIDASGPTMHHALSEFADRMASFRRAMISGITSEDLGERPVENKTVLQLVPRKDDETGN